MKKRFYRVPVVIEIIYIILFQLPANFLKKNWHIVKIVLIGIGCVGIGIWLFINFDEIRICLAEKSRHYFSDKNPKGELIKVILTIIAGIVAVFVWHTGYRRAKATEKQLKLIEKGNIETRFNNAVGHLGNENSAVVLGGIHALHQIAVENKNYTQIIHNLFCDYIRENSAKIYIKNDFEKMPDYCPVIIQTLLDYLFKPYNNKDSVYKDFKSDLSFSTLINYDFSGELNNIIFNECIIERCDFRGELLNDEDRGSFRKDFSLCTLNNCFFNGSTLISCSFFGNKLIDCEFNGTLTKCNFTNGTFINCIFFGGTLTECIFKYGTLEDCYFIHNDEDFYYESKLNNCDFENVELIKTELPENKITEKQTETKKSTKSKTKKQ